MHAGRTVTAMLFCVLLATATPAVAATSSSSFASASDSQSIAREQHRVSVIVVFDNETSINASLITARGGVVTGGQTIDTLPVLFADINRSAIEPLERQDVVTTVTVDQRVTSTATLPSATENQTVPWGVDHTNATSPANALNDTAISNVTVAVLDTGVDHQHEDLNASVVWGVSTVGNGSIEYGKAAADDTDGHGTHVAGTIAAENNDYGVVGVAPGVELYAIQVLNQTGGGTFSDLIEGIDQALKGPDQTLNTSDDADVLSLSLGSVSGSPALEQTIEDAASRSIVVAAAGNSGDGDGSTDNVSYPARYSHAIAVGATDQSDTVPTWSSDGPAVEVAAPGSSILSTAPDDTYAISSGTSMAAPHVTGVIALMLANAEQTDSQPLTAESIRPRLHNTSLDLDPSGRDRYSGYGLIQADSAVRNEISLVLTANTTSVGTNESVEFTITRADTTARVTGHLLINETNETTVQTDENGTVVYRFTRNGTVTVTAKKTPTALESYRETNLSITVSDESLASSYDANGNSKLDLSEIQRAIHDWVDGKLTLTEVQLLINTWATAATV